MVVRETSKEAYAEDKAGKMKQEDLVYTVIRAFEPNGVNNKMIGLALSLPINCVTGRCNDLQKKGLVEEDHRGPCPITLKNTGKERNTIFWRISKR